MGSDPQYAKYPNLLLAQHIFTLQQPSLSAHHATAHKILTTSIKEHSQAPLYRYIAHKPDGILAGKIEWDEAFYNELLKKNEEELAGYNTELKEAEENAGESEVVAAMGKKAELWARILEKACHELLKLSGVLFLLTLFTGESPRRLRRAPYQDRVHRCKD
jgi:26S proteasome regulatory subunit N7